MSFINSVNRHRTAGHHLNWMGGPGWNLSDPVAALRMAAASCFFGEPQYYHLDGARPLAVRNPRGFALSADDVTHLRDTLNALDPRAWRELTPAARMEAAIDAALDADPVATLREAARLRNDDNIRVTPQVILVRAANHPAVRGTGLIRQAAPDIVVRGDEPATGLAYQLTRYGRRPVPNSLKRAWRTALESLDDYQVAKYRQTGRLVKMVDVVNLVHPASPAIDRLVRGEATTSDTTWEAIISADGATTQAWTRAVGVMGHMALLRNVRNLLKAGVPLEVWRDRLLAGVPTGRQLPFRYFSAYQAVAGPGTDPRVLDTIEECLELAYDNAPRFAGRVMSLCDNSGSAWGTTTSSMGRMPIATIANLTGVITGALAEEGHVGVFGDQLEVFPVRRRSSVFDLVDKLNATRHSIGAGTEHGIWLFWDRAIRNREHWDHVFVYSDMQAGHGGLFGDPKAYPTFAWPGRGQYLDVPKLIASYRERVNPDVLVYLVQVAGYQDTIVPESYAGTFILGGWGDGILRYAAVMAEQAAARN